MRSALPLVLVLTAGSAAHAEVATGDRAPELENAKLESGKKFRLKGQRGQWIALTFGGSWCKPCKKELPAWDKLAPRWTGKVTFLAVNIDHDPAKGKKFFDQLKVKNMTRVYMPENQTPSVDAYDPGTFPSTFVIDPNGVVRSVHRGYQGGDEGKLEAELSKLVK